MLASVADVRALNDAKGMPVEGRYGVVADETDHDRGNRRVQAPG